MSIIDKQVLEVKDVLALPLTIPSYQRPYKWTEVHVNQLIDDILHHMRIGKEQRYRLGTIILHQEGNEYKKDTVHNIVDGQQRLLSLSMLSHYLSAKVVLTLLNNEFSSISMENLQHNAAHIKRRVERLDSFDKEKLKGFFLNQCELVCVTLNDISEAFQFFDSQNARGKRLETYDLLKAFHLREMGHVSTVEVNRCVEQWELRATKQDKEDVLPKLKTIINDVLFPIRRWSKGESAIEFSNEDVSVFKGVNFKEHFYPHIAPLRAVEHTVASFSTELIGLRLSYPFQSNQVLVNGKWFFDYIEHYANLYHALFLKKHEKLKIALEEIEKYERENSGKWKGNSYIKKLFNSTILLYYDKFGEQDFDKAIFLCGEWCYRLRLEQTNVRVESINNHAMKSTGLLRVITHATHPSEVLSFFVAAAEIKDTTAQKLVDYFQSGKQQVEAQK